MNREEVVTYIREQYGIDFDNPWDTAPSFCVFRHTGNKKWFVLLMDVERRKLGLAGEGKVDIINVKCDPGEIRHIKVPDKIITAYHMNKDNWVSVVLDSGIPDEAVFSFIDNSFELTK